MKIGIGILILVLIGGGYYFYNNSQQPAVEPTANTMPETTYSLDMIAEHNSKEDCWQAIDGVVYDFTPYLNSDEHPGGGAMAKDCGIDATFRYENDPPHSEYARSLLPNYAIGTLE